MDFDLFSLSGLAASAITLILIFILSLRYLSLLRWVGGQAYVLSKVSVHFATYLLTSDSNVYICRHIT
jgi:hypothetical protein